MEEKNINDETSSRGVNYTKPDDKGVSYYRIEEKSRAGAKAASNSLNSSPDYIRDSRNRSIRKGLIIIGVILACVIVVGVSCNRITGNFFNNLGILPNSGMYTAEPELPKYDYIAQISVEGAIVNNNTDMFGYASGYQHQWTLDLIDKLIKDVNNKGLVVWVDSPGGGVYESDELYLAIKDYQATTGRPVYSVMGSMAASGGYYISAPADKIIANRNTWTGSIGVTMGTYFDVSELLKTHGVKTVTITSGANKAMGSAYEPMTEEQLMIFKSLIDEAYEQFVGLVAEGRNLKPEQVKILADGRIYTAKQALDVGLIDDIGTMDEAILDMQKAYGLENCRVEELNYTQAMPLLNFFSKFASLIGEGNSSDLAILSEMMDKNRQLMPMYIYQ